LDRASPEEIATEELLGHKRSYLNEILQPFLRILVPRQLGNAMIHKFVATKIKNVPMM
jgi:hypothetical protein